MSNTDYNTEVQTIKYISQQSGYNTNIIDKQIAKHKRKNNSPQSQDITKNYIRLTYINQKSQKIANQFRNPQYKIAFQTQLTNNYTTTTPTPTSL